jgi:hypothetical protein
MIPPGSVGVYPLLLAANKANNRTGRTTGVPLSQIVLCVLNFDNPSAAGRYRESFLFST